MDVERAKKALINAHNAGDTEAARKIANALKGGSQRREGVLETAGKSALRGATFGLSDKAQAAVASGVMGISPLFEGQDFGNRYQQALSSIEQEREAQKSQYPKTTIISEIAGGASSGVGLAGTTAAKALGSLARRGGLVGKIGAGAMAGEGAQRVYEAGQAGAGEEGEILGREGVSVGGVLGGSVPAAGALGKALLPKADAALKGVASLARKYDIPLSIDQISGGRAIKTAQKISQDLPFSGQEAFRDKQMKAFNKALLKTVDVEGDSFNRATIEKAFVNAGNKFDRLTKGKSFTVNDEAMDTLSNIGEAVNSGTYGEQGSRLFKQYTDDLMARVQGDELSGDSLVRLRNKFARISRTGSNVDAQTLAKDMENVLIDMIGDGAPSALQDAKKTYKNLIVLEPLMSKAKGGNISPTQLTNRMSQVYGRRFTTGKAGEIGELADVGRELLPELGGSDTQARGFLAGAGIAGAVEPTTLLVSGGVTAVNRALQSGMNRNQAIINSMTKPARSELMKLPPAEANKLLDSISTNLGLMTGMAGQ